MYFTNEQIDEFRLQGIEVYTVSVDESKRKVIVEVERITDEQKTKLLDQYGQWLQKKTAPQSLKL